MFRNIYISKALKGIQEGENMDKDSLPKLEIGGFTNETAKKPATVQSATWREKAAGLVHKAGIRIKITDEKNGKRDEDTELGYRRLLIKTGICAAIAVVILGIASINNPAADSMTQTINDTVNHEFDINEDIGRLKFVDNLNDELEGAFSALPDNVAVYPVEGDVVTTFGQAGSKGVRFSSTGTQIVSIAKGTVEYTGDIDGSGYVKVTLDTGETAVYYNLDPSVKVDDIVKPGQEIGNLTGDYLYLELKSGDEYVDPIEYIQSHAASAVK
jgi:murein DD-endopeptidase MepM/ murein hydrolase activator NlpD